MRYITVDEYKLLGKVIQSVKDGTFDEKKAEFELKIGDTLDVVLVGHIETLKYSNVLLIGIEELKESKVEL